MQRIRLAVLLAVLLLFAAGCTVPTKRMHPAKTDFVFDTVCTITLYAGGDESILDEAFALCRYYEGLFSRTDPNSDIFRLNHAGGQWMQLDGETCTLLRSAAEYAALSDGLFDPTVCPLVDLWNFTAEQPRVPEDEEIVSALRRIGYERLEQREGGWVRLRENAQVDLGGIAKGYVADRLMEFLKGKGVTRAIIDLGGNVAVFGGADEDSPYSLGIQDPWLERGGLLAVYSAKDISLVTSGAYERYFESNGHRYHHILDPDTGRPAESGLEAVTVFAASSTEADALSTACFVAGPEKGAALIERQEGIEALFVLQDGQICLTSGLKKDPALKIIES